MTYQIGIIDDHHLVSHGLAMMVSGFRDFEISFEVQSGIALQQRLQTLPSAPDAVLIDVSMPDMSGVEVAEWINIHYPAVKMAAVSMTHTDQAIRSMLRAGCCAYLLKGTSPNELELALLSICKYGHYQSSSEVNFRRLLLAEELYAGITKTELQFIQLACSDHTYERIAQLMGLSVRTVETIRVSIFRKLHVTTRPGMLEVAFKKGLITV